MHLVCGAIKLLYISHPIPFFMRTNHIEIDKQSSHYDEKVSLYKDIITSFDNSNDQLMDIVTKSLSTKRTPIGLFDVQMEDISYGDSVA